MPGAIVNLHAGCVRRDPALPEQLEARLGPRRVERTGSEEGIGPALERLREAGTRRLVLVGGDGTLTTTLTQLLRSGWAATGLPAIVVSRGGTVNTIATALGARGTPLDTVDALLDGDTPHETLRELLGVRADGSPARCGFIFGLGAPTRWLDAYYDAPEQGALHAARLVAQTLASGAVGGPLAREIFEPFEGKLRLDGVAVAASRFTLLGASAIRDVGLGFQPFLTAGSEPGRFHVLHTDVDAARLALELPPAALGTTLPGSRLEHHSAARLDLELPAAQRWMLDADVQTPARSITITPTRPLLFLGL